MLKTIHKQSKTNKNIDTKYENDIYNDGKQRTCKDIPNSQRQIIIK